MANKQLNEMVNALINEDVELAKKHLRAHMVNTSKRLLEWSGYGGAEEYDASEVFTEKVKLTDYKDKYVKFNIDGKLFDFAVADNYLLQEGIEDYPGGYITQIMLESVLIDGTKYDVDFDTSIVDRVYGAEDLRRNLNTLADAFFEGLSSHYMEDSYNEDDEHEPDPTAVGITLELCTKALSAFFKQLEDLECDKQQVYPKDGYDY